MSAARRVVTAFLILGVLLLLPVAAHAVDRYPEPGTPPAIQSTDDGQPQVLGESVARSAAGAQTLPLTGGDVVALSIAGVSAIAIGAVLVRRGRATRAA